MKIFSVLIIGAGSTGLSTALHLSHGNIKNIGVLEKNFIGSGQTGQCCGFIRTYYNSREMAQLIMGNKPKLSKSFRYNRFNKSKTRLNVSDSYFVKEH